MALPWADMFEPFGQIGLMAFCLKGKHKIAQGNALGIGCQTIPVALKGQNRARVRREASKPVLRFGPF